MTLMETKRSFCNQKFKDITFADVTEFKMVGLPACYEHSDYKATRIKEVDIAMIHTTKYYIYPKKDLECLDIGHRGLLNCHNMHHVDAE